MTLVLLTGATRGIGRAAAIELAREGAEVALVGRESERVEAVAEQARAAGGNAPVHEHVADLSLMAGVRTLADEVRERYEHIDVLANNAGALFASRKLTSEGFEQTFALNHLAPFLLTNLLRDRLDGGRVVTTASDAHKAGVLDLDDLQSEKTYAAMRVYGLTTLGAPFFRSPRSGARSLVWLSLSDEAGTLTGEYVQDEKVIAPSAQAQDETLAEGLWERSAQLVGLPV